VRDRGLFKWGAIVAGVVALLIMMMGAFRLVTGGAEAVALLALGVGILNAAMLLRVMRWEVNE